MESGAMTIDKVKQAFPDEWVLLTDLVRSPETQETVEGKLVFHSTHRADVYARALQLPTPRQVAIFFTGLPPSSATYRLSLYAPETP